MELDALSELRTHVLRVVNLGTIVLDEHCTITIWNRWMERHTSVSAENAVGQSISSLFPELKEGRILNAIQSAITNRLPSVVSQSLHKSPFPLFFTPPNSQERQRLQQAIQILPIRMSGSTYCLIQISDVTQAVNRESLLKQQTLELRSKSYTDGLTGIPNRRRFDEHAQELLRLAKRNGSPLSLIMMDIDFFKQFNDRYGHLSGDQCLIDVAGALATAVKRPLDMVARWGGEEFIALLPDTAEAGAMKIADDMLRAVSELNIAHNLSLAAEHVTISLGVATYRKVDQALGMEQITRTADLALYEAKKSGRNRIACHAVEPLEAATA